MAKATNMRTDHVQALEEGHYAPFPAAVYIRGSVRTYAKLLKLDVMPLMEVLNAELNRQGEAQEPGAGLRRRRGVLDVLALQLVRFGWKRAVIVLVLVVGVVLILLLRCGRSPEPPAPDPLADLPPPLYQPAGNPDTGYLPLPATNRQEVVR